MSFANIKTQTLELVDTLGGMKPSNFRHMISRGQEAFPISLKVTDNSFAISKI